MSIRAARPYALLFILVSAAYHANLRPVASSDSFAASLLPFSVVLDGSITLDRFEPYANNHIWYASAVINHTGAHYYSRYPVAGPLLATPLYLPFAVVPAVRKMPPAALIAVARIAEKIAAVELAAAATVAMLLLLLRLTSTHAAWILTLVFAFGTGNWSTDSQALWQHTYGQLAIIGFLYAVERWETQPESETRWYWVAGIFSALALAIRLSNGLLLPVLGVALWLRRGRISDYFRVYLPSTLAIGLVEAYNLAFLHNLKGGYFVQPDGRFFDGLAGSLLSPGRGLLIYTPIAAFALAALAPRSRILMKNHRLVIVTAGAFSILHIGLIAMWPVWWGGYNWGPRMLTEILPPMMVLIAAGLPALKGRAWRWTFAVAALYGFLIQGIGVFCYPKGHWDSEPISVNQAPQRLWDWADNPIVRTARGGVAWEPYAIVAAAVSGGPQAAAKKLQELGINAY